MDGKRGVSAKTGVSGDPKHHDDVDLHKRCPLSERLLNASVASLNRAFASSVTVVPESAAERNAKSHNREDLQEHVIGEKALRKREVFDYLLRAAYSCVHFGDEIRESSRHIEINSRA